MDTAIPEPRLLDTLRSKIRLKGYSRATEKTYCHWVRQYVLFHDKQHPISLGPKEVEAFLSSLVSHGNVSASTQNQALSALLFLYKHVLEQPIDTPIKSLRAKKYKHVPCVLSVDEVRQLLSCMTGIPRLMAELTYGSGMRVSETLGLRVQDLDFANKCIVVRDGKGRKDRFTLLPIDLIEPLHSQLLKVKKLHIDDLAKGYGASVLPWSYAKRMANSSKISLGSLCFHPVRFSTMSARGSMADGIYISAPFKKRSSSPQNKPGCTSACLSMGLDIALRHTCFKADAT